MINKSLKIMVSILIVLFLSITKSYATGAILSLSKNEAKSGDTIELYINLSTDSIGYDIKIEPQNSNLISSSEVVSKIGDGNASRIYLVQLKAENERQVYANGTRIATIKYKISDSAKVGDKITIKVSGDVVGKSSAEKNTIDETVTFDVVEEQKQLMPTTTPTNQEIPTQTNNPTKQSTPTPTQTSTQQPTPTPTSMQNNTVTSTPTTTSTITPTTTQNTGTLPKAGGMNRSLIIVVAILLISAIVVAIKYKKMK